MKKNRLQHIRKIISIGMMRCANIVLWITFCAHPLWAEKPKIHIVYPVENQVVGARDSTFIYGSVTPGASLRINDHSVRVYPNGGFLDYLCISPGEFIFSCCAILGSDTMIVERHVQIPYPLQNFPLDSLRFDPSYVYPQVSTILRPGDLYEVSVKGTPDCQAFFDIEGLAWGIPMTERLSSYMPDASGFNPGESKGDTVWMPGIYTGVYQIQPWDIVQDAKVIFYLVDNHPDTATIESTGKVTVDTFAYSHDCLSD